MYRVKKMTNEEAIRLLQHLGIKDVEDNCAKFFCKPEEVPGKVGNALQLAIDALEKQIPKETIFNSDMYHFCPTCIKINGTVSYDYLIGHQEYCPRCGQKIKRREK